MLDVFMFDVYCFVTQSLSFLSDIFLLNDVACLHWTLGTCIVSN